MAEKLFTYDLGDLKFTVLVFEDPDNPGKFKATISVQEGSADFNAIYWGDDDGVAEFGGFKGKDSSLNMNGADGSTYDGEPVAWDGAAKLSSPGLGTEGTDKNSFIEEGGSFTFDLKGLTSLDDIDFLGIRATSVNGDGSIKAISVPEEPEEPESLFPDIGKDISNIVLYFSDFPEKPDGVTDKEYEKWLNDGYFTIKIDNWEGGGGSDLDDSWDAILDAVKEMYPDLDLTSLLGIEIKTGNLQDADTSGWDDETPYEFEVLDGPGESNSVFIDLDPDDDFTSEDLVANKDIDVTIQYSVV